MSHPAVSAHRRTLRAVALAGILLLTLVGCQNISPRLPDGPADARVYVVRRAWHIDVGFAAAELQPPLRSLLQAFPTASYLAFGFGDRHYLMTRGHGPGNLLVSIWPGAALILMTALRAQPQEAFGAASVVVLPVTSAQAAQIQGFIWRSLATQAAPVAPVAGGPYPGSLFYAAIPRYSGLHTCNTWAAESLGAGGLPVHSRGVLLADQLWSQILRIGRDTPDP